MAKIGDFYIHQDRQYYVLLPRIINGKQVTKTELITLYRDGLSEPEGNTKFPSEIDALKRLAELLKEG